ncbi:MAG: isocitrate/isopropylmalate family dehydrogenase, partial [Terriglobales bacterium]
MCGRGRVARDHTITISMAYKVTLIPGDGIGPEVTQATVRILEATGVKFDWEIFQVGAEAFAKYNEYIPKELIDSIERTRVGLKGPVTTPVGGGFASINVALRKKFELYANFRPIQNLPHIPTRYPGVDLIIVRENTESLYSGIEHEVVPGVVESLKIITEKASTRIARFAFEYSR